MTNDPDLIKHEIDQIQTRMKARVEMIGNELSPNRMISETLDTVIQDPHGTISKLTYTVRQHPVASALVAAGLASLAGAASRDRISETNKESGLENSVKQVASGTKTKVKTLAKSAKDKADSISEAATETIDSATLKAKTTSASIASGASKQADQALDAGRDMVKDAKRFAEDNPLTLGLFALGVGALAASFFTARQTQHTKEPVGETSRSAKPKISHAKKSTRAKSSPNKTVKKMAASKKTVGEKGNSANPSNSSKTVKSVTTKTSASSTSASKGNAKVHGTSRLKANGKKQKKSDTAVLAKLNGSLQS